MALPCSICRASLACCRSRSRSRTTAACAANASRTRRSSAGSTRPRIARASVEDTETSTSASSGTLYGDEPEAATCCHGDRSSARSSRATEVIPNVSRSRSRTAMTVFSPRRTLPARTLSVSDSAWLRAAWTVRRAARSTTDATATATSTNTTRAKAFSGSAMVNVCTGGVKNQLRSRLPNTRRSRAGHSPPISATPTSAPGRA